MNSNKRLCWFGKKIVSVVYSLHLFGLWIASYWNDYVGGIWFVDLTPFFFYTDLVIIIK